MELMLRNTAVALEFCKQNSLFVPIWYIQILILIRLSENPEVLSRSWHVLLSFS